MVKISVIVPVYNVKNYLEKCLNSIINQIFQDIEILVVDDGSTDGSGELCERIALTDKRIKVFHKENGGVSSARNYALDRVNGEYVGFVDGDDYIDSKMYEILYESLIKSDADIAICGHYKVYGEDIKECKIQSLTSNICCMNREQAIECLLSNGGPGLYSCNKLFKATLFKQVRYPLGMHYEDIAIMVDLLLGCKKVAINSCPLYYYVRREGSTTLSPFTEKTFDLIDANEHNLCLIKEHVPQLENVGLFMLYGAYKGVISRLLVASKEAKKKYQKEGKCMLAFLRKNARACIFNPYNNRMQKMAYIALLISPKMYTPIRKMLLK